MAALAALVFASHAERQGKVCLCNSSSFNTKPSFYAICPAQQPAHCASQRGARTPWTQSGRPGAAMVRHLTAAGLLRTLRTLRALGCELQGQAMAAPVRGCLSACVAASSTLCGVSAVAQVEGHVLHMT